MIQIIMCIPLLSPKNVPLFQISWKNPENPEIWFHIVGPLFIPPKNNMCTQNSLFFVHTHRIHVWYIHLHLVDFYGKCRWIYHTWILWDTKLHIQSFQSPPWKLALSNVCWGSTQLQPECLPGFGFSWKWQVGMPGMMDVGGVVEVVFPGMKEWKILYERWHFLCGEFWRYDLVWVFFWMPWRVLLGIPY